MWILKMQQNNSETTGSATENPSSIGKQHGGTGLDVQSRKAIDGINVVVPQTWLLPIVNEELSCLVSLVNMRKQLPNSLTTEEAKQSLTHALFQVRGAFAPASPQEITSALEVVAEVFRAPLPERQAFKLYVAVFQDLPAVAFKEACRQIVRTHKYPNLPLPAEFINAAQPVIEHMKLWDQRITLALSRI